MMRVERKGHGEKFILGEVIFFSGLNRWVVKIFSVVYLGFLCYKKFI